MVSRLLFAGDLDGELSRAIKAKHIATELQDAIFVATAESPEVAYERLRNGGFDQAPVRDARHHTVGWVDIDSLQSSKTVRRALKRLDQSVIVAAEASVEEILSPLQMRKFIFVVDGPGLSGFITPSDIDRSAVRSHFYLQLSAIEAYLAAIVSSVVPRAEIEHKIMHRGGASGRWKRALAESSDTDPVEYLYFSGLVGLFLASSAAPKAQSADRERLDELVSFRNDVAHATNSLVQGRDIGRTLRVSEYSKDVARELEAVARNLQNG